MNTKGFTLVELLAVIVILSLLALITSTAVTKLVSDAKNDLSTTQIALIKSSAETWMADNLNKLPDEGECSYLTLEDLKNYGLLDSTVLDPKNNQEISDDLKIKISTTLSKYGNPVRNVEVNPTSIEGCSQIYFPICTIADDSNVQGLNVGAKYNCTVDPNKDSYTFYVLTSANTNSTTVNMIMESNIRENGDAIKETNPTDKGLVSWYSGAADNTFGPTRAMVYLQTATQNWTNLNILKINTFNDISTVSFKMSQEYNVYARLPKYSEVSTVSSQNLWLFNFLENTITGSNKVTGVYGYWTQSSHTASTDGAWAVIADGSLSTFAVNNFIVAGIRPVITVPINRITQTNQ